MVAQVTTTTVTSTNSSNPYDKLNGEKKENKASDIQDRFLTLLVKQMQSQDPMNPMDNAQVTTQMAQINTVTGLERLNDGMGKLLKSNTAVQSVQAAGMIGRQVLGVGHQLTLAGGVAQGGVEVPKGATAVQVGIYDSKGGLVKTLDYEHAAAGNLTVQWDGVKNNGEVAEAGGYSLRAKAIVDGEEKELTTLSYSKVLSVLLSAEGAKVSLSNGDSIALGDVKQIM